jgi:hypothetical protein
MPAHCFDCSRRSKIGANKSEIRGSSRLPYLSFHLICHPNFELIQIISPLSPSSSSIPPKPKQHRNTAAPIRYTRAAGTYPAVDDARSERREPGHWFHCRHRDFTSKLKPSEQQSVQQAFVRVAIRSSALFLRAISTPRNDSA